MASARVAPIPAGPVRSFWRTPFFAALVIAAAGGLAYLNSLTTPFVFDDEPSILENPSIRSLASAWSPPVNGGITVAGRPLLNFSFALNYRVSRTQPWSYHALNLFIHIAAGALLFGIVRRTLMRPALAARFGAHAFETALLATLLWVVHPLQTESVTYVVQRAESLMGLFFLLTLWCFIRASESGASPRWRWAVVAACVAGMATKEVMVVAPLIVLLYDRTFIAGNFRDAWRVRRGLYLALAATWLLLGALVLGTGGRGTSAGFGLGLSPWQYLLTQADALVLYLRLTIWPHPLSIDYGTGVALSLAEVWWQGVIVLALLAATIWAFGRKPALGFLGGCFFLILAPSSSFIPVVTQTIAEHRMYLPLAALTVLVTTAGYARWGRKAGVVLGVTALALLAGTVRRNQDYANAIGLFEDTVARHPGNARAMALLADYYRRAGRLGDARQLLERSLAVQPGVVPVLNNLGTVWQELGDAEKAATYFRQSLALKPGDVSALGNLGNALILSGHLPEGIGQLEIALRAAPNSPRIRANLANALAQSGRMAEAAEQFETLLKAQPGDAEAHENFSDVLQALGRKDQALAELETAVRLEPRNAERRNQLGIAFGRAGRMREALKEFQEALRLNPALDSARQNAARAARMLGGN